MKDILVQDVRVQPNSLRAWRAGQELSLSPKEYRLLVALITHAGVIVTRPDLMRRVWDTDFYTSSKTIDVHIGWLRRKLGDDPRWPLLISTVRGKGFRFETGRRRP